MQINGKADSTSLFSAVKVLYKTYLDDEFKRWGKNFHTLVNNDELWDVLY